MPNMLDSNFDSLLYLFKGEPGTRKSTQAMSFPVPQYWFSWDRKMEGIYLPMKKWGVDPSKITYDDYDDWSKPRAKLEQLQLNCPYKTLVFDSITSMADMTLRQTVKLKYGTTKKSGGAAGKQIAGIAVNEIEDYNAEAAALQELIALVKDIKKYHKINIILIAHVAQAEYRDTAKNITHISRTIVTAAKKVAHKIPAYCDEVYHFNIKRGMIEGEGGDYSLLTEHTGDDFARTSIGLDREIVFKDQPIYQTYIEPAINKLRTPTTTSTSITTTKGSFNADH
jgi:AAA domain-containing protein